MKMKRVAVAFLLLLLPASVFGQAETVPAGHTVYDFLKRLEVRGLIVRYHDAVLPLGRREVAGFLNDADAHHDALNAADQDRLRHYLAEFAFDRNGSTDGAQGLIAAEEGHGPGDLGGLFSPREKFLFYSVDSVATFFVNGLVDLDYRGIRGDALGTTNAEYLQLGGRVRGSLWGKVGFGAQLTNAGYRGSHDLLARDPIISQSHALSVTNARNFDFAEGYVRYDGGLVAVEVGRERVLWGTGYGDKLTASDNVRVFDFVRADVQYKALKYTFLHGWLLGSQSALVFSLPSDTAAKFVEPIVADKYFAAHRLELSFPHLLDVGVQEMIVYSNRAPDLAYLNPLNVFEPAQRSRGERDNDFWSFDLQLHMIPDIELTGTMLFDDINLPDLFSRKWTDRHAWQVGMMYADMFHIPNTTLMVEYTRVEPYVFAHNRSRDDSYTSLGRLLGTPLGPNADNVFVRADYAPLWNLTFSVRVSSMRKGLNVVDSTGHLVKNVGGDALQPHRDTDPDRKSFLDGILVKSNRVQLIATWECVRQLWISAEYQFDSSEWDAEGRRVENHLAGMHVRWEF